MKKMLKKATLVLIVILATIGSFAIQITPASACDNSGRYACTITGLRWWWDGSRTSETWWSLIGNNAFANGGVVSASLSHSHAANVAVAHVVSFDRNGNFITSATGSNTTGRLFSVHTRRIGHGERAEATYTVSRTYNGVRRSETIVANLRRRP